MQLTSTSFPAGGELPQQFGKRAANVSPQLAWEDVPEGTGSFALSFVDTHPVARGYVHWLLVDIDGAIRELPEGAAAGALPDGVRELQPYAGPFPPSGTHEYLFTLYALAAGHVPVPEGSTQAQLAESLSGSILTTAALTCTFTRR